MFASFFYADVQEDATWMSLTCVVEHFISDILSRSNGATMRFEPEVSWGANAGLKLAQQMLEPVTKQKLCKTEPKQWVSFCTFYRSFTETFKSEVQGEEQISFSLLFRPVDLCCLCCHRRDGWRESSSVCKRTLEFFLHIFALSIMKLHEIGMKGSIFVVQSHRCLLLQGVRTKPVVLNALCGKVQPARRRQLLQFWDTLPWDFLLKL